MIEKNDIDLERSVQDFVTKMKEHVAALKTCGRDGLEALNQSAKSAYDTIILQLDQVKPTLTTDDQKNAWQTLISSIQNLWNSFLELIGVRKRGEDLTSEAKAKAEWDAKITSVTTAFDDYQKKQDDVLSLVDAGQDTPAAPSEAVAAHTKEVAAPSEKFEKLTKDDIASKHNGKRVFTVCTLEQMQEYRKNHPLYAQRERSLDARVFGKGPGGKIYYASRSAFSARPSVMQDFKPAKRPGGGRYR